MPWWEPFRPQVESFIRTSRFVIDNGKDLFDGWVLGPYNERKLQEFAFLHQFPLVGPYMDYLLDHRKTQEYFARYGMDYTDVHDPRKVFETSSLERAYGSALNFVSDNIKKLYR